MRDRMETVKRRRLRHCKFIFSSTLEACSSATAESRAKSRSMSFTPSNHSLSFFHSLLKLHIQTRASESPVALFRRLLQSSLKPNDFTFSLLLKASASSSLAWDSSEAKREANQIHSHLLKSGFRHLVYVSTALLDLYSKLGCMKHAQWLFDDMPDRDVVAWNALICGYSRNGYDLGAFCLLVEMFREGFSPHMATLVAVLPSCGQPELVTQGKSLHGVVVKAGLGLDSQVKNVLTSMYAKCGDLKAAELLFEEMVERSVVAWNTMIGAYGQSGLFGRGKLLFKRMREENVEINSVTIISLLSANANPEPIHCFITKTGIINDASVITSLICEYAKLGDTESSVLLYKISAQENLVSLTAIISSYAEKGDVGMLVACFARMQQLDIKVDEVALVSILHGFKNSHHISIGLAFHGYGVKSGLCIYSLVTNGLISMYSKFDDIEAAFTLFAGMHEKPLDSWNSIMSCHVQAGRACDVMDLFRQMTMYGHNPDAITIGSILSSCSQMGYLQLGKQLHCYVLRNNPEVEDFVGTALVDMYTKCGNIEQAERVFNGIEEPCLATWNTMITGYSLCGFEHKALTCYTHLQQQGLKPDEITFLGVLAACTYAGLLHEGRRYFQIMTEEFYMAPSVQHCACMVGLLGRAGLFEEALLFVKNMESQPDSAVWGALLSACCTYQEVKLGEYLAKKLYLLDYRNGGLYVLMSNLYAARGMWEDVERVREMMKDTGGDGCSGASLIEVTSFEDINANNLFFGEVHHNTNSSLHFQHFGS